MPRAVHVGAEVELGERLGHGPGARIGARVVRIAVHGLPLAPGAVTGHAGLELYLLAVDDRACTVSRPWAAGS